MLRLQHLEISFGATVTNNTILEFVKVVSFVNRNIESD